MRIACNRSGVLGNWSGVGRGVVGVLPDRCFVVFVRLVGQLWQLVGFFSRHYYGAKKNSFFFVAAKPLRACICGALYA